VKTFIKLTLVKRDSLGTESEEAFYMNTKYIVSIHPEGLGAAVYEAGSDNPFHTVESVDEILSAIPEKQQ
jgi:hypothetical protein